VTDASAAADTEDEASAEEAPALSDADDAAFDAETADGRQGSGFGSMPMGNAWACYNLAVMYENGAGIERSREDARRW